MNYMTGEVIKKGDLVLVENRRTYGVIEHIIETEEEMRYWNLYEQGVLLESDPFGSVFWPLVEKDDPVVFVSRAKT